MRRPAAALLFVVLASACTTTKQTIATPFPSQEPISDFFARLSPGPSASPLPSPSPTAGARSASDTGTATAKPAASHAASSARVACPSGQFNAEVNDLSSTDQGQASSTDRRWDVSASGTVTNNSSASVRSVVVAVKVHSRNGHSSSHDVSVPNTIGPGATVNWSGRFRYLGPSEPEADGATVVSWTWANSSLSSCPT